MNQKDIDAFFRCLDEKLGVECEIILLGASAGALMGHIRPSLDIDFEIRAKKTLSISQKQNVYDSVMECSRALGIAVNFSDDIGHWSMIDFLDYRKTATAYKKIGKLTIKLLAPEYWTIGKMARSLELDIQDIMSIVKIKNISTNKLIAVWARALKTSELSLEMGQFRKNVEYFLNKCGPNLWGKTYEASRAITLFRKQAGIRQS